MNKEVEIQIQNMLRKNARENKFWKNFCWGNRSVPKRYITSVTTFQFDLSVPLRSTL